MTSGERLARSLEEQGSERGEEVNRERERERGEEIGEANQMILE